MELYPVLRLVHILGAAVLFGSGAAIAFFMLMAWRSGDRAAFAMVARHVVLADWVFTASAVILQPISGLALAHLAGWPLTAPWLVASVALYLFIGACWLPVVWIQMRVKARLAVTSGPDIPADVHRLMRIWFALGWPAFAALIAILWLMITKPG
ncbi:hypothetical protein AWH62_08240 [Maricaulis sp. W15]|uniref:DUF2269 family protein n=1 Tax=Maricaulis sp. W15 TaxID=1772333 RepID=UPI0009490C94|nr:DUF2269 domain-containing protein [Maricaulis sp. W15]OLF74116.1 hypothetical protein AWH62_08240 [Maricaulis sp. W15]